jgi:hypothetical protein
MNDDACQRYLEDPEAHAAHLETCAECRALFGETELPADAKPLALGELPLASWEGAAHRAWPVVIAALLVAVLLAAALFLISGVSPLAVVQSLAGRAAIAGDVSRHVGEAAHNAPRGLLLGAAILFVLVNAVLFALLSRAPKGIDA